MKSLVCSYFDVGWLALLPSDKNFWLECFDPDVTIVADGGPAAERDHHSMTIIKNFCRKNIPS
jgi:hypothetical protein